MSGVHYADLDGAMSACADALGAETAAIRPDFATAVYDTSRDRVVDPRELLAVIDEAKLSFALSILGEGIDTERDDDGTVRRRYRFLVPIAQLATGDAAERLYFDRVEAWENYFHPGRWIDVEVGPRTLTFTVEETAEASPLFLETAETRDRVGHTHMRRLALTIEVCNE